jgi:hypothetical protein
MSGFLRGFQCGANYAKGDVDSPENTLLNKRISKMLEHPVLANTALLLKANIMRYDHFTCNPDLASLLSERLRAAANVLGHDKHGLVHKITKSKSPTVITAKDIAPLEEVLHYSMVYIEKFTKKDSDTRLLVGNQPEVKFLKIIKAFDYIMNDLIDDHGLENPLIPFEKKTNTVEIISSMREVGNVLIEWLNFVMIWS